MDKFLIKKYMAIVVCLITTFVIISISAVLAYNFTLAGQDISLAESGELNGIYTQNGGNADIDEEVAANTLPDLHIMVLGIDDEASLPDLIMMLVYDGTNNLIDVISVPRDTQITITPEERALLNEANRWAPNHGVVKLNELHSHGGPIGHILVAGRLEQIFDIEIDYYVILDLDALEYMVDMVGGIYMDIRPQGIYYNQGGTIDINIPGGRQLLTGNMAQQVVRFRQMPMGDLDRIRLQQQFMGEFFVQVLGRENIMNNLAALLTTFITHVRTDFGLFSALRYLDAVPALNPDSIDFHMTPGVARDAANPEGRVRSYYFIDEAAARELMNEIKEENAVQAEFINRP